MIGIRYILTATSVSSDAEGRVNILGAFTHIQAEKMPLVATGLVLAAAVWGDEQENGNSYDANVFIVNENMKEGTITPEGIEHLPDKFKDIKGLIFAADGRLNFQDVLPGTVTDVAIVLPLDGVKFYEHGMHKIVVDVKGGPTQECLLPVLPVLDHPKGDE